MVGDIKACREGIQRTKQRGHTSDAAAWLLEKIDVEHDQSTLISLIGPIAQWAERLTQDEKDEWLVWAFTHRQEHIRAWLGYAEDWTMLPAPVCKNLENAKRIAHKSGLPCCYLLPGLPQVKAKMNGSTTITLDNGMALPGIKLRTITYVYYEDRWWKVYKPKQPSVSAVCRAVRLFILSVLAGRLVTTTKDLYKYEVMAIREWLMQGETSEIVGEVAARALYYLVTQPDTWTYLTNRG